MRNFFPFLAPAAVALTLALVGCSGGDKDGKVTIEGSLSPTEVTMTQGSTREVIYSVVGNAQAHIWSDDRDIATAVIDGDRTAIITAHAVGTVRLILTRSSDNQGLATCTVRVTAAAGATLPLTDLTGKVLLADIPDGAILEIASSDFNGVAYRIQTEDSNFTFSSANTGMVTFADTVNPVFTVFPVYGETTVTANADGFTKTFRVRVIAPALGVPDVAIVNE